MSARGGTALECPTIAPTLIVLFVHGASEMDFFLYTRNSPLVTPFFSRVILKQE